MVITNAFNHLPIVDFIGVEEERNTVLNVKQLAPPEESLYGLIDSALMLRNL